MAPHSSVLAWRIPGTGEPHGLLSLGSHRVGHNWSDLAAAAATVVKDPLVNAGVRGLIPESGICPGMGNGNSSSTSILACKIQWTEEPGGLQFMGLQRVSLSLCLSHSHTHTHTHTHNTRAYNCIWRSLPMLCVLFIIVSLWWTPNLPPKSFLQPHRGGSVEMSELTHSRSWPWATEFPLNFQEENSIYVCMKKNKHIMHK